MVTVAVTAIPAAAATETPQGHDASVNADDELHAVPLSSPRSNCHELGTAVTQIARNPQRTCMHKRHSAVLTGWTRPPVSAPHPSGNRPQTASPPPWDRLPAHLASPKSRKGGRGGAAHRSVGGSLGTCLPDGPEHHPQPGNSWVAPQAAGCREVALTDSLGVAAVHVRVGRSDRRARASPRRTRPGNRHRRRGCSCAGPHHGLHAFPNPVHPVRAWRPTLVPTPCSGQQ